ncbi:MAG: hypothetical protein ABSF91_09205 [Bacteroidota bacterium]|jgi:hypothetical protein
MPEDLEQILRPVDTPLPKFPAKCITLKNGQEMVMRQVGREAVPLLLPFVEPLMHVAKDFYNIVGARVYAELLSYSTYRVQDEYVIVGQVEGELVAIVNGRIVSPDVGMSYHTLSLRGGLRIGAHAFATKMEYHLDVLKQKEVLVVAESPIGFRRWMTEYNLEKKFHIPHELGGCPSWSLTKELYEKAKSRLVLGKRPVPDHLLKKAEAAILPPNNLPLPPEDLLAANRAMLDSASRSLLEIQKRITPK